MNYLAIVYHRHPLRSSIIYFVLVIATIDEFRASEQPRRPRREVDYCHHQQPPLLLFLVVWYFQRTLIEAMVYHTTPSRFRNERHSVRLLCDCPCTVFMRGRYSYAEKIVDGYLALSEILLNSIITELAVSAGY